MRELTPDRPDKTESPYTVDAGHFQLEMDVVTFTLNRSNDARIESWNVTTVNFKIGLLNNVDLQFIFDNYLYVRTEDRQAHQMTTQSGVGDITTRLKINLWGNDGGQTAFGVLPSSSFQRIPIISATTRLRGGNFATGREAAGRLGLGSGNRVQFPAERARSRLPRGVCQLGDGRP